MIGRRTLRVSIGSTAPFLWAAPAPVDDASPPTVTFRRAGVSVDVELAAVHAEVSVDSIARDRITLTLADAVADADGVASGPLGLVWLLCADGTGVEARLSRISDTVAVLTKPLAANLTPASIQWAVWSGAMPAAVVASAADVAWSVAWTARRGANAPAEERPTAGIMRVQKHPFVTSLTSEALRDLHPWLQQPSREAWGFEGTIAAALDELEQFVEARGLIAVSNAEHFVLVHADMVALRLAKDADRRAELRTDIDRRFDLAISRAWQDANADGVVDAGEITSGARMRAADMNGGTTWRTTGATWADRW